jgi:putative intracellular protease/amidase
MTQREKIAVLIESHFDGTEPNAFAMYFPANGYDVEFISNLRGATERAFKSNDTDQVIVVSKDLDTVQLSDYRGLILVGGYAMDMLRYEVQVEESSPNEPKATQFMRRAMQKEGLVVGTICHSLWLLTPAPDLLKNRKVTCGHNVMHDVKNAGATLVFDPVRKMLVDTCVDGNLVTGRHPYAIQGFMDTFLAELRNQKKKAQSLSFRAT